MKAMRIITFAAIKGGVGKTTLSFNFGEYLAYIKEKKVLLIDLDHQCNLTQTYDVYESENTVANIFKRNGNVNVHHVSDKIDLIAGDMHLDEIETSIENQTNKNMLMYMWLNDNYDKLEMDQYDYIILDTHPDFSVSTKNAIVLSHAVISPITPSEHGYNARFNLEERLDQFKEEAIDFNTRKSYVTAQLMFLANMVKSNTHSSRVLLEEVKDDKSVVGKVPERELFNLSTLNKISLARAEKNGYVFEKNGREFTSSQKNFLQKLNETFNYVQTRIDNING